MLLGASEGQNNGKLGKHAVHVHLAPFGRFIGQT